MAIPSEIPLNRIEIKDAIINKHNMIRYGSWGKITPKYGELELDWNYHGIAVHHSGNWGRKCPDTVEKHHRTDKAYLYPHIGYHYLIHPTGKIYEGRSLVYKAAHLSGANTGRIGILFMGDYDHQFWDLDDDLSNDQLQSAYELISTLKGYFPIAYLGGHKEYMGHIKDRTYTCPGNILMAEIPKMRQRFGLYAP